MRFTAVILFFIIFAFRLHSQDIVDSLGDKKLLQLSGYNVFLEYISDKKWEEIVKEIYRSGEEKIQSFNSRENVYILFVGVKDLNEFHIIHRNEKGATERIVEQENVYFIWLDDDLKDDYEVSFEVVKRASALQKDFNSIKSWFAGLKTDADQTRGPGEKFSYYYKILKIENIVIPCDINIGLKVLNSSTEKYSTSVSYINHEISYYNISLGVSATSGVEKNFLIKDKQLYISDKGKKEWQGQFILGFNFHFARDVDDWDPSPKVWTSEFWNSFHRRLNIFTGLEISTKPLDNLYLGLGINITKDIQMTGGIVWRNNAQLNNGQDVGDINSIDDLNNYFPKKYEQKFYFGLSFSTGMVARMLGVAP